MMTETTKLIVCSTLTLVLVLGELILGQFSHCLTLLAVTNQSIYNLINLIAALMGKNVSSTNEV